MTAPSPGTAKKNALKQKSPERQKKAAPEQVLNEQMKKYSVREISEMAEYFISLARGRIYKNTTNGNFFGTDFIYIDSILSKLALRPGAIDGIICTDGKHLDYNPELLVRYKIGVDMEGGDGEATITGVLAHEALHILLGHSAKTGRGQTLLTDGTSTKGESLLADARNLCMDREVNRHVLRLFPDMHKGKVRACRWPGMAEPFDGKGYVSFEDLYVIEIDRLITIVAKILGREKAVWKSIPDGERELLALCDALEKREQNTINDILKKERGAIPPGSAGSHKINAPGIQQNVSDALDRAESVMNQSGYKYQSLGSDSVTGHLKLYGCLGRQGVISGNWNDAAKAVMASVAGEQALDDWSVRDPYAEVYSAMGFGEMATPGIRPLLTGSVVCALDVSLSVSDDDFLGAWLEMASFAASLPPQTKVAFVQVDTDICSWEEGIVGDTSFSLIREKIEKGIYERNFTTGQTDFHSFFRALQDNPAPPDCLVLFSDLDVPWQDYSIQDAPECPVFWVTDNKNLSLDNIPPFGEIFELGEIGKNLARERIKTLQQGKAIKIDEPITLNPSVFDSVLFDMPF